MLASPRRLSFTGLFKDEVDAVRDAIGTLDRKIAETEQRLRQDQDKREREQEAARRREQVAPRTAVMLFSAARWNEDGQICTGPQYGIVKLPVELAKEACARNLAVRIDDPRYHQLRQTELAPYGQAWAKPLPQDTTVDLDHPDAPPTSGLAGVAEWIGPAQVGTAVVSSARW